MPHEGSIGLSVSGDARREFLEQKGEPRNDMM